MPEAEEALTPSPSWSDSFFPQNLAEFIEGLGAE
jgi:hypothetical protein